MKYTIYALIMAFLLSASTFAAISTGIPENTDFYIWMDMRSHLKDPDILRLPIVDAILKQSLAFEEITGINPVKNLDFIKVAIKFEIGKKPFLAVILEGAIDAQKLVEIGKKSLSSTEYGKWGKYQGFYSNGMAIYAQDKRNLVIASPQWAASFGPNTFNKKAYDTAHKLQRANRDLLGFVNIRNIKAYLAELTEKGKIFLPTHRRMRGLDPKNAIALARVFSHLDQISFAKNDDNIITALDFNQLIDSQRMDQTLSMVQSALALLFNNKSDFNKAKFSKKPIMLFMPHNIANQAMEDFFHTLFSSMDKQLDDKRLYLSVDAQELKVYKNLFWGIISPSILRKGPIREIK